MNEVIIYGGLPLTRADVYRDALKKTGDVKAASMFAFGERTKKTDQQPISLEKMHEIEESAKSPWRND